MKPLHAFAVAAAASAVVAAGSVRAAPSAAVPDDAASRSMAQPPSTGSDAAGARDPDNPDQMPIKRPPPNTNDAPFIHRRLPNDSLAK